MATTVAQVIGLHYLPYRHTFIMKIGDAAIIRIFTVIITHWTLSWLTILDLKLIKCLSIFNCTLPGLQVSSHPITRGAY